MKMRRNKRFIIDNGLVRLWRVTSNIQHLISNIPVSSKSIFLILVFLFLTSYFSFSSAELIDRVVAFVGDKAITQSEFQQQYENTLKLSPHISKEDVLNTMINRKLLLREAKKYRIKAPSEEEIIKAYIDLKVRAFVRAGEKEISEFYKQNIAQFSGKDYEDVREEIEEYLLEKEINERLRELIEELRENAYIKIQLKPE